MSGRLRLTLACGDYEIMRPLKEGTVTPDGVELTVLTAMDSATRHWRFLRRDEFDVAEVSASSYVAARDRLLPFRAIPVFPHRRFRHGFAFVNTAAGIRGPGDLAGRRVGVKSFMTTAILWLRGILQHEHGLDPRSVEWVTELDDDVAFTPPPGLHVSPLTDGQSLVPLLLAGELDAVLSPDLIQPLLDRDPRVARLFANHEAAEAGYHRRTGIFPIMHVVGLRAELVERHPWLPINLFNAFQQAKTLAMRRMRDPRLVPLAWYREAWERQEVLLGPDPWEYGLTARNRHTMETLTGYSHEQGLTGRQVPLDELFLDISPGRHRGVERF